MKSIKTWVTNCSTGNLPNPHPSSIF